MPKMLLECVELAEAPVPIIADTSTQAVVMEARGLPMKAAGRETRPFAEAGIVKALRRPRSSRIWRMISASIHPVLAWLAGRSRLHRTRCGRGLPRWFRQWPAREERDEDVARRLARRVAHRASGSLHDVHAAAPRRKKCDHVHGGNVHAFGQAARIGHDGAAAARKSLMCSRARVGIVPLTWKVSKAGEVSPDSFGAVARTKRRSLCCGR